MSGMTESAFQHQVEEQLAESATIDPVEAVHLLRQAHAYVSRYSTIGAQKLADQIKTFTSKSGIPLD